MEQRNSIRGEQFLVMYASCPQWKELRDQMAILSYFTKVSCGQKRQRTKKAEQGSMLTFRKRLKWTEVSTGAPIDTTFPTKTQDPTGAL
uniref:Uncharacterized protein n=1 Tax=Oryza meridionalis TaxID=40149 RepID=A0A0E0EH01_9ORYZ